MFPDGLTTPHLDHSPDPSYAADVISTKGPADVRAANRLRTLRERAGLTREEFLRRCRADAQDPVPWVSPTSIANIEKAQVRFPWHHSETFARVLGVSLNDLLWPSHR